MLTTRVQPLVRSFRAPLAASSAFGPTSIPLRNASYSRAVAYARQLSSTTVLQLPYRRFGDPPRPSQPPAPAPRPRDSEDPAAHLSSRGRPIGPAPADARQVFALLQAATGRRGRGSGFPAGGPGSGPGWRTFQAYLRSPVFLVLVAGGGTYYVLHLEKVPETGRWRFMDVSPALEQQMGAEGLQQVMSEYGGKVLPDWHPQARYVQGVVKRIIRANGLEDKLGASREGWKTHVVKDDRTKNAFVLPNGSIFVFTGILSVANDEDSLACVLGHEIAHQVARHSAERMSGMKVLYGLAFLLSSFGIDAGVSQIFLNYVFSLPNSRKNETEGKSDLIGLRLANTACFDPRAAEGLWRRMSQEEGADGVDLTFLSTHPSSRNRSQQVREWAEEVLKDRPSQCGPVREQVAGFQALSGTRWR